MKICPLCGRDIRMEKSYLLLGTHMECWLICKSCERILYLVTDHKRKRIVHLAVEDLKERLEACMDSQLKIYVSRLIEARIRQAGMHKPYL